MTSSTKAEPSLVTNMKAVLRKEGVNVDTHGGDDGEGETTKNMRRILSRSGLTKARDRNGQ